MFSETAVYLFTIFMSVYKLISVGTRQTQNCYSRNIFLGFNEKKPFPKIDYMPVQCVDPYFDIKSYSINR